MITLALMFAVIFLMLGITWWMEEGPEHFYEPEPLAPVKAPRFPKNTKAGYKPPRRTRSRKEIQYR